MIQSHRFLTWAAVALLLACVSSVSGQAGHVDAAQQPADGPHRSASDRSGPEINETASTLEDGAQPLSGKVRRAGGGTVLFILMIAVVNFGIGFGTRHALPHLLRAFDESHPRA